MKILLDENLPESLIRALRKLGHEVTSINRLRLKGMKNGMLYREVASSYDACFTKDAGFAHNIRQVKAPAGVKVLRVIIPQQEAKLFVPEFIESFSATDFSQYQNGDDWPLFVCIRPQPRPPFHHRNPVSESDTDKRELSPIFQVMSISTILFQVPRSNCVTVST